MSFFIEVLCTESIDSAACVIVGTDSYRFIFNCGEGVQRLCVEHKVRLGKIGAVLTTDFKPQNCFGLPGLCLTLSDAGNKTVTIAGPSNLHKLITASRHFMRLPDHLLAWSKCPTTENDPVTVVENNEVMLQQVLVSEGAPGWGSYSYIGRTPALLGKFDVKKAQALNVPKGELFGKLKNGNSVTLADGTVVRPEQVLGDAEPSKYFVVVCSVSAKDRTLLQALLNNTAINRYRATPEGNGDVHCMVHLSPTDTVQLPEYQAWMRSFGPHVTHILCGTGADAHGVTYSAYAATAVQCSKMQLAVPELFPALRTAYSHIFPVANNSAGGDASGMKISAGIPGMKYNFLPLRSEGLSYANAALETQEHAGVLWERAKSGDNAEAVRSSLEKLHSAQAAAAEACRHLQNEHESARPDAPAGSESLHLYSARAAMLARCEGQLSFLGTGCAIPSKYRNVSGILLDLPARSPNQEEHALLIDAGESTWVQMLRLAYETEHAQSGASILTVADLGYRLAKKIKTVWISHPHADHHLGLVRVIVERKRALLKSQAGWSKVPLEPLVVIAPGSVLAFLREYSALNGFLDGAYIGVSCRSFDPRDDCTFTDSYWNQDLLGEPHGGAEPEPDSPRSPGRRNHHHRDSEVKRQRLDEQHASVPGMHHSASFPSRGSASPRPQPVHTAASAMELNSTKTDACVNPADASLGGGRGWRNFMAVFREEISTEVRALVAGAKIKALAVLHACGISSLVNVQVVHCGQSYGLCLEFDNGATPSGVIKLVYSGDTRPCDNLVEAGLGATVLIHEATFEDDKQAEAVSKRHSTMGEAAEVGHRMGAYRVLFTHFSQRYPGVPQLAHAPDAAHTHAEGAEHGAGTDRGTAGTGPAAPVLAFDFMRVSLRDLLWAPATTALLAAAYPIGSSNSLEAGAAEGENDD